MVRRLLQVPPVPPVLRAPRAASAAAVLIAAASCASPTLPLPPPLAPTVSPGPDADHVTLTATCNAPEHDVVIITYNQGHSGAPVPNDKAVGGAKTDSCGGWQTVVFAHRGDALEITYELGGELSLPATVWVR